MIIRNPTVEVCVVQILAIFGWWAEFGKVMGPFPAMFSRAVGFLSFVVLHKDWGSRRDNFPRLITGRISFHRSFVQPCFIVDPVSLNIYIWVFGIMNVALTAIVNKVKWSTVFILNRSRSVRLQPQWCSIESWTFSLSVIELTRSFQLTQIVWSIIMIVFTQHVQWVCNPE